MATLRDIAKILVEKHQIKDSAANEFLQHMVEVINDGLVKDRIVKIKGFGTFKLQEVKERGSVNVNTGEPVVIAAHDKVTFMPDAMMRDLVNKPFANFDTVILDDDAPLAVEPAVAPEHPAAPEIPEESNIEKKAQPVEVKEPETVKREESTKIEEPERVEDSVVVETPEPEPEEEMSEPEPVEEMSEPEPVEEMPYRSMTLYYAIIINVLVAATFFVLGYLSSKYSWFESGEPVKVQIVKPVKKPDIKSSPKAKAIANTKKSAMPATYIAKPDAPAAKNTKTATSQHATVVLSAESLKHKFDSDPRVKHGAYYITGTKEVVTVKKGQTLKGISRSHLGPDMECYIEAYNGKKEVKEGDKLMIPSLKYKKTKK